MLTAPDRDEGRTTMRVVAVLSAAVALVLTGATATRAEVMTKDVTFPSGKEEVKGFLAMPDGKGPFPAIVVIQEWWGLNDWVKDQAKRLAKEGYVALAPDLYRGKVASKPDQARKLMMGLPQDRAIRDLKGATDYLAKNDRVNKERIGVIGWCMGGGLALQHALKDQRLKACAICYGRVVTNPKQLEPLQATILGVFGKEDRGIKIDDVRKFKAALDKAGKKVDSINEYDAGHGFMREGGDAYKADATRAAWQAIDRFFAKTLKGK
jgi:carboxymethylenebutenolidase